MKNRQLGIAHLGAVLLVVVLIVVIGFSFWWIKDHNKKSTNTSTSASVKSTSGSSINQPAATQQYLTIKEWAVKFQLPSNLTSMGYELHGDLAYLGSDQLVALASTCSVGNMALGNLQRSSLSFAGSTKVGSFYYAYNNAQSGCTDSDHPQASNMQATAINQLKLSLIPQTLQATN